MNQYKFLEEVLKKVHSIKRTLQLLEQSNINIENKVEQATLLEEIQHEIITHDLVQESLITMQGKSHTWQLDHIERIYKSSSALPLELVKSLSKARIECINSWKLSHSDHHKLKELKKHFTELIKLTREAATAKSEYLKCSKYDTMLVTGIMEKDIKEIFPKIGSFFSKNIDQIIEAQSKKKIPSLKTITIEKQIAVGLFYLNNIKIDTNEISALLIDNNQSDFCDPLFSILRYSSDVIYRKQSIKSFLNTGIIEEIQGLFIEKILGTSMEFVEFIQPYIQAKVHTRSSTTKNLYLLFNKVNPSPFLKKADEFTLLAHIMLRTKLEQDIIDNKLEVKDLQDAWLEGMKYYKLPIKAKNELETYFQDQYWINGMIGHFPMKMIALILATQIFVFIKANHYEYLDSIKNGNFSLLTHWFSKNIYSTQHDIFRTLKKLTGRNIEAECYTNYLTEKYNLMDCI